MANRFGLPDLGVGLGLRTVHYRHIVDAHPAVAWFEILSENYMQTEGRPLAFLDAIADRYPVAMHGVSLSIGSTDPLDRAYLAELCALRDRTGARWVSDHLCWTGVAGKNTHDLLPMPYTEEALAHVVGRVKAVQDALGAPLALENPSTYVELACASMSEVEFLARVADQADCAILLDVNNVFVSAHNHGFDAGAYLAAIPFDRVVQLHVAGHTHHGTHIIDSHIGPVSDAVWRLAGDAWRRAGGVSVLLEWDAEIPSFEATHAEALRAHEFFGGRIVNRYLVDLDAHHERASATPDGPARAPRTPSASLVPDRGAVDASLAGAQRWLIDAITRPEAVGLSDARAHLTDGPRLTALERLDIYRRGYRSRLAECLADDYPVLRHALGPARFDDLCDVYLERFPSQSPSLNSFSRHLEALCREGPPPLPFPRELYADLAALEWAVVEVVHAPSAPPLTPEGLRGIADDGWPRARLVANTAVRLLRLAFPVNAYFQAVREGGDPPLPGAADSATVVYRSGSAVWRMDLTAPMHAVLAGLLSGEALGVALARAEEGLAGLDEASIVARVTSWFGEWVGSGLFVAVTLDDDRGGGDDG